jgi:hypothetical protein
MRSYKLQPKQAIDYAIAMSNRRSVSSALPLPQISVCDIPFLSRRAHQGRLKQHRRRHGA